MRTLRLAPLLPLLLAFAPPIGWTELDLSATDGLGVVLDYERQASVAVDPDGYPLVVWPELSAGVPLRARRWNGADWIDIGATLAPQTFSINPFPRVAFDPEGAMYAAWNHGLFATNVYVKKW